MRLKHRLCIIGLSVFLACPPALAGYQVITNLPLPVGCAQALRGYLDAHTSHVGDVYVGQAASFETVLKLSGLPEEIWEEVHADFMGIIAATRVHPAFQLALNEIFDDFRALPVLFCVVERGCRLPRDVDDVALVPNLAFSPARFRSSQSGPLARRSGAHRYRPLIHVLIATPPPVSPLRQGAWLARFFTELFRAGLRTRFVDWAETAKPGSPYHHLLPQQLAFREWMEVVGAAFIEEHVTLYYTQNFDHTRINSPLQRDALARLNAKAKWQAVTQALHVTPENLYDQFNNVLSDL